MNIYFVYILLHCVCKVAFLFFLPSRWDQMGSTAMILLKHNSV